MVNPLSSILMSILLHFRYSPEFPIKAWIDVKVDGLLDQRKLEPMIAGIVADEAESQMMSAMESMQNVLKIKGDSASVPTKQDQEQKSGAGASRIRSRSFYRISGAPEVTFIGSFCLKRSSCSIWIFCSIEAPVKIHMRQQEHL